jgi:hypothetical protein
MALPETYSTYSHGRTMSDPARDTKRAINGNGYGKSKGSYDETLDHFGAGFGGAGWTLDSTSARDAREEVLPLVEAALRERPYITSGC